MLTLKIIKETVESVSGVDDISTKNRVRYLVECRFVYCGLCRVFKKDLRYPSLEKIGNVINRDHATVLYGKKQFKNLYNTNDFTGTDIYDRCVNLLTLMLENPNSDINKLTNEQEIKQFYKIKHARLSEKYRLVINSLSRKLRQTRRNDFVKKIMTLSDEDLKELEFKFDTFFKVKEKLKQKI